MITLHTVQTYEYLVCTSQSKNVKLADTKSSSLMMTDNPIVMWSGKENMRPMGLNSHTHTYIFSV